MSKRWRTSWLAGGTAVLLILSMSGVAAAAGLVSDSSARAAFVDLNGNGIDDTCEVAVVADATAAAAAQLAADLNGDGILSTSESAQSGRIGGVNCNHGGYVSSVAEGTDATPDTETPDTETPDTETPKVPAVCPVVVPVTPTVDVSTLATTHGAAVSLVAQSTAVGGKNCNHGGAVSEAAKGGAAATGLTTKHAGKPVRAAKTHGKGHQAQ